MSLSRTPGHPPPYSLCPGKQHDNPNRLYAVVAHTQFGDIPGKALGNNCWYAYGGKEHTTHDFSYILGAHGLSRNHGSAPAYAAALGRQNDCGTVYVAVAHVPEGDVPGKALGNTCWYPYGGVEKTTADFSWVVSPLVNVGQCGQPGWHGCPHGVQNDGAGNVYCAIAHGAHGDIPGKAQGNTCWYAWGGAEHVTHNFSWVVGHAHLEKTHSPHHPALGRQNDCGAVWVAIANTPHGTIPGKAIGNTCWYPYGGKEHTTHDFHYVVPH